MTDHQKQAAHDVSESTLSLISPALIEIVWRRKWYLIAPVLISLALGAACLTRLKPQYRIQARVLVQQRGLPLSEDRRPKNSEEFLATQAEIIRSPAVVKNAVASLPPMAHGRSDVDPTTLILGSLSVKPVLGTNVLSIGLLGPDAEEAARTVEAIIASYREYLYGIDHDAHLESLRLLTHSDKELREDLHALQQQYLQIRKHSPLMGQGRDAASVQRSLLTHLGQRLTDARNRRMELNNRVQSLLTSGRPALAAAGSGSAAVFDVSFSRSHRNGRPADGSVPEGRPQSAYREVSAGSQDSLVALALVDKNAFGNVADVAMIRRELFRAQAEQEALAGQYGPKHPEMRAVQKRIAVWRQRLAEAQEAARTILQQELQAAGLQEKQLANLYQEEFDKAKAVDGHLIEEQQVLDSIQRAQSIHDSILSQVRQWQLADQALAEGRSGVKLNVLEAPAVAERLVFPPPLLLLTACTLIGLIGGSALITIMEHTDPKVQSAQQIPSGRRNEMYTEGRADGNRAGNGSAKSVSGSETHRNRTV